METHCRSFRVHFTWLVGYSSLLGPVGGILIADYYFIRKQQLYTDELYSVKGLYTFGNGYNGAAIVALLLGIVPNIPGFLMNVKVISADWFPSWIGHLYDYAWFVGFFVSGLIYFLLMKKENASIPARAPAIVNQTENVF